MIEVKDFNLLSQILSKAEFVSNSLCDLDLLSYKNNDEIKSSVMFNASIISSLINDLSRQFILKYNSFPWIDVMVRYYKVVNADYIDDERVYYTLKDSIDNLVIYIKNILR